MKKKITTLTEEISRMKTLFTEERLYGNLVEQHDLDHGAEIEGTKEESEETTKVVELDKGKKTIITDFDKDYDYKAENGKWQYKVKGDPNWKNINVKGADVLNKAYPDMFKGGEVDTTKEKVTIDIEAIKKGGFDTQKDGDAFRKWVHADPERLKKVDAAIAAKGFADDNLDLTGAFNNEYIKASVELVGDEYVTTLKGSDTEGKDDEKKGDELEDKGDKKVDSEDDKEKGDGNIKPDDAVEIDYKIGEGEDATTVLYYVDGETGKVWDKDDGYVEGLIAISKGEGQGWDFKPSEGYRYTEIKGDGLTVEKIVIDEDPENILTRKRIKDIAAKFKEDFKNDDGKKKHLLQECKEDLNALGIASRKGLSIKQVAKNGKMTSEELRDVVQQCMVNFGDKLEKDRSIMNMVTAEGIGYEKAGPQLGDGDKIDVKSARTGRRLGYIKKLKRANMWGAKGRRNYFFLNRDREIDPAMKKYILQALNRAGVDATDIAKVGRGKDKPRDKFKFRAIT